MPVREFTSLVRKNIITSLDSVSIRASMTIHQTNPPTWCSSVQCATEYAIKKRIERTINAFAKTQGDMVMAPIMGRWAIRS